MVFDPGVNPRYSMADASVEAGAAAVHVALWPTAAKLIVGPGVGQMLVRVAVDEEVGADEHRYAVAPVFPVLAVDADAARVVGRSPSQLHRDVEAVEDAPPEPVPSDVPCDPGEGVGAVPAVASVSFGQ